jgi:hypothetical protein
MANIKTYNAPAFSLVESDKGGQAWSQAGRRLGPLYNEAAQFTREAGKLAADNKAQLWPFDILELYQRQAAEAAKNAPGTPQWRAGRNATGAEGLGSTNVYGGRGGLDSTSFGGGSYGAANGQISQGAAALGQGLADGGQAASRRSAPGQAGAPAEDYTLDQGNIVTMSASRKAIATYNSDQADALNKYQNDQTNTSNYWQQYNGNPRTDTSFDPSPIDMQNQPPPPAPSSGFFGGFSLPNISSPLDLGVSNPMSDQ